MKYLPLVSAAFALAFVSCESMNAPLTSSGDFDPLAPAGGGARTTTTTSSGYSFKPGQFVHAMIDNTAFFTKRPKGDADADKLLARDTRMKVVSSDSSYVKVELDSGEVGFVPSVMVTDPNAPVPVVPDATGGIYMPQSGPVEPLPDLAPSNMPPDGIPPVIDPSVPPPADPGAPAIPGAAPATPEAPAATPESKPAPLPPGIDD